MTIEQQIAKGFAEKCAEYGVDPELMAKEAGLGDTLKKYLANLSGAQVDKARSKLNKNVSKEIANAFKVVFEPSPGNKDMVNRLSKRRAVIEKQLARVEKNRDLTRLGTGAGALGATGLGAYALSGDDKEASARYLQGFAEKCAEYGVDPVKFAEEAGFWGGLGNMAKGLGGAFTGKVKDMWNSTDGMFDRAVNSVADWTNDATGGAVDYLHSLSQTGDHSQASSYASKNLGRNSSSITPPTTPVVQPKQQYQNVWDDAAPYSRFAPSQNQSAYATGNSYYGSPYRYRQ